MDPTTALVTALIEMTPVGGEVSEHSKRVAVERLQDLENWILNEGFLPDMDRVLREYLNVHPRV